CPCCADINMYDHVEHGGCIERDQHEIACDEHQTRAYHEVMAQISDAEDEMHKCYAKEDATAHDRAEKAEAERDEWRERYVELSERMDEAAQDFRITAAERDEWQAKYRQVDDLLSRA